MTLEWWSPCVRARGEHQVAMIPFEGGVLELVAFVLLHALLLAVWLYHQFENSIVA